VHSLVHSLGVHSLTIDLVHSLGVHSLFATVVPFIAACIAIF
jgi:hypothetical protein